MFSFLQAIEDDPSFATKVGQIVVLGGGFFVNGNVNPAAEANVGIPMHGDISAFSIHHLCQHEGSKAGTLCCRF